MYVPLLHLHEISQLANEKQPLFLVHDIYMSNGFCHDKCNPLNYAFAITQGYDCWCSNYAPGQTTSVKDCADICPGYPYEYCGSTKDNLFGYISLLRTPSGTVGGSASTRVIYIDP